MKRQVDQELWEDFRTTKRVHLGIKQNNWKFGEKEKTRKKLSSMLNNSWIFLTLKIKKKIYNLHTLLILDRTLRNLKYCYLQMKVKI